MNLKISFTKKMKVLQKLQLIVLKKGMQATEEGIIAWAKERMAAYKYPRRVEFLKELPMSATGKILKKELRQMEAEK